MVVIGSLNLGGTERHVCQVLPRLQMHGFEVCVATLTQKGELASTLEEHGIPVLEPPLARWLTKDRSPWRRTVRLTVVLAWLWGVLRRRRPDIVHTFLPEAYVVGGLASLLTGVPTRVMSRRGMNIYHKERPAIAWLEGLIHPRMTAIVGNSRAVLRQLKQEKGVRPERLHLLYNGIDPSQFAAAAPREQTREKLDVPRDALALVIVANLIPYKGHADLIEALGKITTRLPDPWRLLCVGRDDGMLRSLRSRMDTRGIGSNILWLGSRSDVPDILAASDIGILCSHQEGFSNAILEGMAAGLPMIVTDVGGNAEAVAHGKTGLVVPAQAPNALAAAILELSGDAGCRRAFGEAGRRRVVEQFSLDRCVRDYEQFYQMFLDRPGRAGDGL